MPGHRLKTLRVEKPWGRRTLWQGFDDVPRDRDPVGEIWFDAGQFDIAFTLEENTHPDFGGLQLVLKDFAAVGRPVTATAE